MARVLIVEDELLIVEDLKHKLRRLGHNVVAYSTSGEAAVEAVAATKPDLVLMDVRLSGVMNGIEAAQRIREIHSSRVVYVTAHATAMMADSIDQSHPSFFLTKPFTTGQLEAVIAAAIQLNEGS